jgi:preprotein translocase subunit YajC
MTNLITILAGADSESSSGGSIFSFLLLPLMLVAMYFLIIRPNSKRKKDAAKLQSVLEVGDEVMTTSGIIGTITGEDGPTRFWLEIDSDIQVRIARGGIQGRLVDDKNEPESDDAEPDVDTVTDDVDTDDLDTEDLDADGSDTDGSDSSKTVGGD